MVGIYLRTLHAAVEHQTIGSLRPRSVEWRLENSGWMNRHIPALSIALELAKKTLTGRLLEEGKERTVEKKKKEKWEGREKFQVAT